MSAPNARTRPDTGSAMTRLLEYRSPLETTAVEPSSPEVVLGQKMALGGRTTSGGSSHLAAMSFPVGMERKFAAPQLEVAGSSEVDLHLHQIEMLKAAHEVQIKAVSERERNAGYMAAKADGQQLLQEQLERVVGLIAAIERSTHDYLQLVEREVVTLALDIAHRVLKHEAQIDPLLLRGAVRAALDAISSGAEVELVVPEKDVASWRAELETVQLGKKKVEITGDASMCAGDCICRLTTGRLDLGMRGQLGELERSFSTLLETRGAMHASGSGRSGDSSRASGGRAVTDAPADAKTLAVSAQQAVPSAESNVSSKDGHKDGGKDGAKDGDEKEGGEGKDASGAAATR